MAHVATITIDHTKVSADLTDFPVYINLADMPALFWSTVANGGGDIRVYKSDGTTELAREVVSCDTATDTGELHVKYSGTLSSSVDTEIQIHADGSSSEPAASATYGKYNTWVSGYKIVSHDGGLTDSTTNVNSGTNSGTTSTTGKIGDGRNYDGSNDYILSIPINGFSTSLANLTVTTWANPETATNSYWFSIDTGGTASVHLPYSNNNIYFDFGGARAETSSGTHTGATSYWAARAESGAQVRVYKNTTQLCTATYSSSASIGSKNWTLGRNSTAGSLQYWDGVMDEVRFYEGALTTDWMGTEYNNQNSPATFYAATAPPASGPASLKTWNTVAKSSVKSINGVLLASVKSVNTIT